LVDVSDELSPYQIFNKVAEFEQFLTEIVITESSLYAQQI